MWHKIVEELQQPRVFATLGGRSKLSAIIITNTICITNSKSKSYQCDEQLFNIVLNRFEQLDTEEQ